MSGIPNPLLLDIPSEFESERLLLRVPRPGDGPTIYAAMSESVENMRPWFQFVQADPTVESNESFARRSAADFLLRKSINLLLFRKSDGLLVGSSGFNQFLDWSVPRLEIGYWVRTSLQGQGYVTEAVKAETDFGFRVLQAERIQIRCDTRNTRSAAVAERAGYTLEATLRRVQRDVNEALADYYVYSMIRAEWEAAQS